MKLFFCPNCKDIVNLRKEYRECFCGLCSGQYIDNNHIIANEPSIVIMINTAKFKESLKSRKKGTGDKPDKTAYFEAYVAPLKGCHKVKMTDRKICLPND